MGAVLREILERDRALLFRNTRNPTVGGLRDKKKNCSTRRGLRVGTGFVMFLTNSKRLGFLPTCVLFPLLNTLQMFELNEAVRGRLISLKPWDRIDMNF